MFFHFLERFPVNLKLSRPDQVGFLPAIDVPAQELAFFGAGSSKTCSSRRLPLWPASPARDCELLRSSLKEVNPALWIETRMGSHFLSASLNLLMGFFRAGRERVL
jgi:hypothetical protein